MRLGLRFHGWTRERSWVDRLPESSADIGGGRRDPLTALRTVAPILERERAKAGTRNGNQGPTADSRLRTGLNCVSLKYSLGILDRRWNLRTRWTEAGETVATVWRLGLWRVAVLGITVITVHRTNTNDPVRG